MSKKKKDPNKPTKYGPPEKRPLLYLEEWGEDSKDLKDLKNLCSLQCTQEEVCTHFDGISTSTLDRKIKEFCGVTYREFFNQWRHKGTLSLRRAQWVSALQKGNVRMQIHLGKNLLGQRDRVEYVEEPPEEVVWITPGVRKGPSDG